MAGELVFRVKPEDLRIGWYPDTGVHVVKIQNAGHHPDVLMRAIQGMHSEIRGWNEAEAEIAEERESNE